VTAFAGDGQVTLAWQPRQSGGAYTVLRGTSPTAVTKVIAPSVGGSTYTDTTAANGTTYYYAVRAADDTSPNAASTPASAKPVQRTCAGSNPVAAENCLPGGTGWKVARGIPATRDGIEGFTTRSSIAPGDSVDLKVNASDDAPYHIDVYRTGWYGGDQGRLVGRVSGLVAHRQPDCPETSGTGESSCAAWARSATISTTAAWPSGVYTLKLVREDNGAENLALLVVRDGSRTAPVLFDVPTSTYQAYNPYGGRSVYSWNSCCGNTVAEARRAVKASFDRPYDQSVSGQHDFYTQSDVQTVGWLERQGYDIAYADSLDVHAGRAQLDSRQAVIMGAHDEYVSAEMRAALEHARDAGVSIASFGANSVYWRIRFEPSPVNDAADRTVVVYKTAESGPADPSGIPTTTWRDSTGSNRPENALLGGMYVGDNSSSSFPLYVTANQGKHRFWRYTPLDSLAPGSRAQVDYHIVGWEWDRRVDNGQQPPGVEALSSSPVQGNIMQNEGRAYAPGSETAEATIYRAAGGATVFSSGTNQWGWGLGYNVEGVGEPDSIIQQGTANVLADMGIRPTTPSGISLDAAGHLQVTARTPAPGASAADSEGTVQVTFDRPLDPSTVDSSQLRVTRPDGSAVAGSVSYDAATRRVTFKPDEPLDGNTTFRVTVGTQIAGWSGAGLATADSWTFTTGPGAALRITSRTPAAGDSRVDYDASVKVTFNRSLDPATVTTSSISLASSSGPVPAQVSYDSQRRTVTITPSAPLESAASYWATVSRSVTARDGTALAVADSWGFTTFNALRVVDRTPGFLATGVARAADIRATFARAADPSTITAARFTLTRADGTSVPGSITYDASTNTAILVPSQELDAATTYTARLDAAVKAADGAPLAGAYEWTFTTGVTDPAPAAATSLAPPGGATDAPIDQPITATFDQAMTASSITATTFLLTSSSGQAVAGTVSYDAASRTASLVPRTPLAINATYQVRLTATARSALGRPLAADISWSFTTGGCPCSTMDTLAPSESQVAVSDGRAGGGTLELGTKFAVDRTVRLTALKYYKSPGEGGQHTGRLWSSGGGEITSVTFSGESASGWQSQALDVPITLRPGRVYVASVGMNNFYVASRDGLAAPRVAGPLRTVADGANGIYADHAGDFRTMSWLNSN
jgi:hypothetical protein